MSELTHRVRRMLSQAQTFATDAPLEALSRAQLALRTARAALTQADDEERPELQTLCELAETRSDRYQAALAAWSAQVRAREELYNRHERERLQRPLPEKV
jgi:hypothetical protein